MNKVNILEALTATLEASHRLASELKNEAKKEQKDAQAEKLHDFLGSIFGARFGGDDGVDTDAPTEAKPEAPVATTETPVEAPVASTTDEAPAAEKSVVEKIVDLLQNGQYKLRTLEAIKKASGFDGGVTELKALLDENDVEYVVKTRRADKAKLFGLASRN